MSLYSYLTGNESSEGSAVSNESDSTLWNRFSRKVFVGNLPSDVTNHDLQKTFAIFGHLEISYPNRNDNTVNVDCHHQSERHVFLVYRFEAAVHRLLANCTAENGRYFIYIISRNFLRKKVQVRPWRLDDCCYISHPDAYVEPSNTVFIKSVPRSTRAIDLVNLLEASFGKVLYASLHVDPKLRYPLGPARIVFARRVDYVKAMTSKSVEMPCVQKLLNIEPYVIRESMCSSCGGVLCNQRCAPYFCPEPMCLQYYCERCWNTFHYKTPLPGMSLHLPYVCSGNNSTCQLTYVPHLVSNFPRQPAFATMTHNIYPAAAAAHEHLYRQYTR